MTSLVFLLTALFVASCVDKQVASESMPLDAALASFSSDEHDDLHSVVVIQESELIAERYFGDGDAETLVDVRSAGKSVTSLLFGIALDRGLIEDVDDPVEKYWPEASGTAVGPIPLRHILDMRSGLAANDDLEGLPGNEDLMDASDNPLSFALGVPALEPPGQSYRYNSLTAYIAGVVIARATEQSLEDFAEEALFRPLGIERWKWEADRSGETKGQGNLFLTAEDFARVGEMVLKKGSYKGKRIVSEAWIEKSLSPRIDISASDPFASDYGSYWYRQNYLIGERRVIVHFASGNGGNKIYVIPELDLVVSVMSTAYGQGRGQRRSEGILLAVLGEIGPLSGE